MTFVDDFLTWARFHRGDLFKAGSAPDRPELVQGSPAVPTRGNFPNRDISVTITTYTTHLYQE